MKMQFLKEKICVYLLEWKKTSIYFIKWLIVNIAMIFYLTV